MFRPNFTEEFKQVVAQGIIIAKDARQEVTQDHIFKSLFENGKYFSEIELAGKIAEDFNEKIKLLSESENAGKFSSELLFHLQNIMSQIAGMKEIPFSEVEVDEFSFFKYFKDYFEQVTREKYNEVLNEIMSLKTKEEMKEQAIQTLEELCINLNEKKNTLPLIGREVELFEVAEVLGKKTKANPILLGEPGVGKSAIVEGLAKRIKKGQVPDHIKDTTIYEIDLTSICACMKDAKLKMNAIIDAAKTLGREKVILFIDEAHQLITGPAKLAQALKPALARGEIAMIAATTEKEYKKYFDNDPAFQRRFQPVKVDEPTPDEAIEILNGIKPFLEKYHNLKINNDAIITSVNLSDKYIKNRRLPDKAIDILDTTAARIKTENAVGYKEGYKLNEELKALNLKLEFLKGQFNKTAEKRIKAKIREEIQEIKKRIKELGKLIERNEIKKSDVLEVFEDITGIPANDLDKTENEKILELDQVLKERVKGQDQALEAVATVIKVNKAGLGDPNRPIGSFMFLGPTGVGKTETVKALAEALGVNLHRFDMSEYQEQHTVARLFGAPPGYVGYEEGGQLTDAVKTDPYSVILFDEVEKAHPKVFDALLQVLDDGRLTDGKGVTVDFSKTIIILTSNIASKEIIEIKDEKARKKIVWSELKKNFRPEFLNRLDEVVVFNPLDFKIIEEIIEKRIEELKNMLLEEKGIIVDFSKEAKALLHSKGFDPVFGARPLNRIIKKEIKKIIAIELLKNPQISDIIIDADLDQEKFFIKSS